MVDQYGLQQIELDIQALESQKRDLRRKERNIRMREGALLNYPAVKDGPSLKDSLGAFLPDHLMPGNVGSLTSVMWPFWFQTDFDFGVNPTLQAPITNQTQSFQVSQESGFILMSVCRTANDETTAGDLGPYLVDFKDRQSSRQFNDKPVPIQMIGTRSNPSIFPTPMLIMPNAFFDVTMTSWQTVAQATVGSGKHHFTFFGYRVRIEDAQAVMNSIFKA